jgi:hypothetical protein
MTESLSTLKEKPSLVLRGSGGNLAGMTVEWLSPVDAIAAIRLAKAQNVKLLGFDAADLRDGTTQPSLRDSWDYISAAYPPVTDPYGHAAQFIQERAAKGLHFEIVLAQ